MLIQRNDFTKLASLLAVLALSGCQLVVGFDRDRIPDDGGGMDGDMQERDAGPDDGGPTDAGPMCGNSTVEGDEQCDDGANGNDEDGCTDACEFTCVEAADCSDDMVCNGDEVCTDEHICASGTPPADGAECGTDMVCFEGGCITPMCGNSAVEPGEQCDDGMNGDDTDGCTDECMLTCADDAGCSELDGPCTDGVCVDAVCEAMPTNEAGSCDDGNMCTSNTTCAAGVCEGGDTVDCSGDATFCADSMCNPSTGACEPMPRNETMTCPSSDMCLENTTCSSGVCGGGTAVDCSDMDGMCVVGTCDSATGCTQMNRTDGFICDDTDACTTGDVCTSGVCGGAAVDCSGSVTNDCQAGMCDPTDGSCTTVPANEGMSCDDGDPCTTDATCASGTCGDSMPLCPADETCNAGTCECGGGPACGGATPVCDGTDCVQCLVDGDCASGEQCVDGTCGACDPDGDVGCGAGEVCDPADLTCVGCVDSGDCSGSTAVCDTATSTCVGCLDSGDCSGSTAVCDTTTSTCVGCLDSGDCSGSTSVCDTTTSTCVECTTATDCDDSEECTTDTCSSGVCMHSDAADGGACMDGTTAGMCVSGMCCPGCVDGSGACVAGTDAAACGAGGGTCAACGTGEVCTAGVCGAG